MPPEADEPDEPRSRVKLAALIVGGWLVVSLVVLGALLSFNGRGSSNHRSVADEGSAPDSAATTLAVPDGWVQQAADDQTNCAAHAYGKVQAFFATTPCASVHRSLATTNQAGRAVVVASNIVTFATAPQAQQYLTLVNSDGTGNISDLLREGVTYQGAPTRLPPAAFASRRDGVRVFVAEAAYAEGKSSDTDSVLEHVAQQAIAPG